jgi:hypothetical protein
MIRRLALALSALILSNAVCAEPCTVNTKQKKVGKDAKLIIRNEECPNNDRRVVIVLLQRNAESPRLLLRKTQRLSESPVGGAKFIDLGSDGIPEIELTGYCSQPNCGCDIYKLAEDEESIYHYYKGGYSSVTQTSNYLVTASYGSYSSWEYLAYDLAATQTYPIGEIFQYSIFVEAIESTAAGEVLKSKCTISSLNAAKKLTIDDSPPTELLKFCENYGKNYVLAKRTHARRNQRVAP